MTLSQPSYSLPAPTLGPWYSLREERKTPILSRTTETAKLFWYETVHPQGLTQTQRNPHSRAHYQENGLPDTCKAIQVIGDTL